MKHKGESSIRSGNNHFYSENDTKRGHNTHLSFCKGSFRTWRIQTYRTVASVTIIVNVFRLMSSSERANCAVTESATYLLVGDFRLTCVMYAQRVISLWRPLQSEHVASVKADSPITCRAHAVPLPCRAAKGLVCAFPIWFTQCGRVWFTLAMPMLCSDHAVLLKATA